MNVQVQIGEKEKVLVVDDMPQNIQVLADLLRLKGYSVETTTDPRKAFELALSNPPDLIVLDIMMPEMTGYELCRKLKAETETRHIPVIFVSALGQQTDILEAFSSGGVDYITKPFRVKEVSTRIRNHLAIRRLQIELEEKNQALLVQNEALRQEIERRQQAEQALTIANARLQLLATTDPVTGIANRLHFETYFGEIWEQMGAAAAPVGLLLCDVDAFKQINDLYGHPFGDSCLRLFSEVLHDVVPEVGLAARFGGDEFALVVPNGTVELLERLALDLERGLQKRPLIPPTATEPIVLAASIGVASMVPSPQTSASDLLQQADTALYANKAISKN